MSSMIEKGLVFDVQRFSLHDGPGIRTTVFMKGCPLSCWWCANPESMKAQAELGFVSTRCDKCGKCADVCPAKSIALGADGKPTIDRNTCSLCGECVKACFPEALTIFGRGRTVSEVLDIVARDQKFYQGSGGVTVSGGEPLAQPSFVFSLLKGCRELGIHTCVETSGYGDVKDMARMLTVTDYLFFDLKNMDPTMHRRYTGRNNELILENARMAASSGVSLVFRIPLVPGVNDGPENILETARFAKKLRQDARLEILPYHRMGKPKWAALGRAYRLEQLEPPSVSQLERVMKSLENSGVKPTLVR